MNRHHGVIFRNLANITSVLGVLPLCLLLTADGHRYLPGLIVYSNIMDDLDGILAVKLGIKSQFGAALDNLCDVAGHVLIVMVVAATYGDLTLLFCPFAVTAILLRTTARVDPSRPAGGGTATNELMRHILFVVVLAETYGFDPAPALAVVFVLNSVSMLVRFEMPHVLRSRTTTATHVVLLNVALVAVWLLPYAAVVVAAPFLASYLYSLLVGMRRGFRSPR